MRLVPWLLVAAHAALIWAWWNPAVGLVALAPLSLVAGVIAVGKGQWVVPTAVATALVVLMYVVRAFTNSSGDEGPLDPIVLAAIWWIVSMAAFSVGRIARAWIGHDPTQGRGSRSGEHPRSI